MFSAFKDALLSTLNFVGYLICCLLVIFGIIIMISSFFGPNTIAALAVGFAIFFLGVFLVMLFTQDAR